MRSIPTVLLLYLSLFSARAEAEFSSTEFETHASPAAFYNAGTLIAAADFFFKTEGGRLEVQGIEPASILPAGKSFRDVNWGCGERSTELGTIDFPGLIPGTSAGRLLMSVRFFPCGVFGRTRALYMGQILPEISGNVSGTWSSKGGVRVYELPPGQGGVARARIVFTMMNTQSIPILGSNTEMKNFYFVVDALGNAYVSK